MSSTNARRSFETNNGAASQRQLQSREAIDARLHPSVTATTKTPVICVAVSISGSFGKISFMRIGCVSDTNTPAVMAANAYANAAIMIGRRKGGFTSPSSICPR